ncbi:MAG TPA: hypothetical protein VNN19_01430, partial [bacterium]|nr:hypothetical protein [bacterium]
MAIDLSERTPARLALRLLLLGAVLLLGYRFLRGAVHYVTSGDLRDFVHGYTTARWVLAHGWDGLYDLSIQVASQREFIDRAGSPWLALPFVNLPPMVFLFMPLAPLPPEAALACWISANVLLGVAAIAA